MSMILSVYSQNAFREIVLPDKGQTQQQILLRKDLFRLHRDILLNVERDRTGWKAVPGGYSLSRRDGQLITKVTDAPVTDGLNLLISNETGDQISILAYEQSQPFSVYHKYRLVRDMEIKIGKSEDSQICYQSSQFVSGNHCSIRISGGTAKLYDTSKNGTFLNFRRVFGNPVLHYGDSIRIFRLNVIYLGNMLAINERDGLTVRLPQMDATGIEGLSSNELSRNTGKILFRRAPRNLRKLNAEEIEIESPPNPQDQPEMPLAMAIGPAMTMAIPMMLGSGMSIMASRMTGMNSGYFMYVGIITAVSSAVIGAVWALVNVRYTRKQKKITESRRFEKYSEYLIRMKEQVQKDYNENTEVLRSRYLPAADCCALNASSPLLWNRNMSHEDYMSYRLGLGDIPFQEKISIPKEKFTLINDSLAEKPKLIRDSFLNLKNVPVLVDFLENRLVGIAGGPNRKGVMPIIYSLIAQIVTSNCYTDVKLGLIYDDANETDRGMWDFMMWFPHVWSEDRKIRYIATNKAETNDVCYALSQIFRNRSEERNDRQTVFKPQYVLIVADPKLLDGELLSKYIYDRDLKIGLTTILLADRYEDLPNACECIIENDGRYQGIFHTGSGMENGTKIAFDATDQLHLKTLSKVLGQIEVVESEEDGEIPNVLTFFDMFGISNPEELAADERWKKASTISSMKALVGFKSGNHPCYLDIHEKYHGPHGLLAGTTGSGKSETLQTYILSLAANYSPDDIGFFIIDYKGGGMANLFEKLPHMIGAISNLSGNQVKRAMVSIKSENRRRQRIFTEFGVNNINSYTSLFKSGDATEPIPHLFIIIDEFAELKKEEPDFMKELISVAQVGRSLGVHLILSTQRPSGTVDENIWANSKFRLCLRVQDRQDSMDMLHRPDAAYLTQTGRCYLQVGNDEIFELFQSGWSGASYDRELGGHSLLVAQMLSATGKVDLAGNHAKIKRKESLGRKWLNELIGALHETEEELAADALAPSFDFTEQEQFRESFYRKILKEHPDFEQNHYNNARIGDFISVYREVKDSAGPENAAEAVIGKAAKEGKRLPEIKSKSQLEATVDYLAETAKKCGFGEERKLWLPVLPEVLYLETMDAFRRNSFDGSKWPEVPRRFRLNAVIGLGDDPANQAQMPVSVDFAEGGHHVICGTVATGKSTFLQSVVYSLCASFTPEQLNVYCLDFSSHMLSVFEDLKHVGGVMYETDAETDRLSKFFTMITKIIGERKKLLTGTNFADFVNHNGWNIPAVLIVIDNYGSFHEKTGEAFEPIMSQIVREGVSYGIFLLVSSAGFGMAELPTRLSESFRTEICLEMQDPFAYGNILHVMRPEVLPETNVKGRGLIYYGERIIEFQTALAAQAADGPERNDLIREAVKRMNRSWNGTAARTIPVIPEKPVREDFTALAEYQTALSSPDKLPAAYDAEYADVYSLDLFRNFIWLITGTKQSGKTVFLKNLILTCAEHGDRIFVIEQKDTAFLKISEENSLTRVTDGQGIYDLMKQVLEEMKERAQIKKKCMEEKCTDEEMFAAVSAFTRIDLFITDMELFVRELYSKESPAYQSSNLFETLCEKGKFYNIYLFGEVKDADQSDLLGYKAFRSMREYRSAVRFGGRMNEQSLFTFENIKYQEQEKSLPPGIGIVPSDDKKARLEKLIVPLYRG